MTPLHYSVENGYIGVVKCLISHGADINAKDTNTYFLLLICLLFITQL